MKRIFKIISIMLCFAVLGVNAGETKYPTVKFDKVDFNKTKLLLSKDILNYYKVKKDKYDTPLKEKKFKESSEFQDLSRKFDEEYTKALHQSYDVSTKFNAQYDIKEKNFSADLPKAFNKKLVLKTGCPYFEKDKFVTPVIDEDTAYKIETTECTLNVIVKLTGKIEKNKLVCYPVRVDITNKAGDVLYSYNMDNTID